MPTGYAPGETIIAQESSQTKYPKTQDEFQEQETTQNTSIHQQETVQQVQITQQQQTA